MELGFLLSFCLETKGPKIQGRHQRPYALGGRPSVMSAVARAPSPVKGGRSHSEPNTSNAVGNRGPSVIDSLRIVESKICGLDPQLAMPPRPTHSGVGVPSLRGFHSRR